MTDTILSLTQVEDFFQNLTLQMLGLDPTAASSQSRVRIGWPKNGYPGWKIDEDVSFLLINLDDDPITQQMDVTYLQADANNADRNQSYTRVHRVNWIFYGPNSFNDADTVRSSLYRFDFIGTFASNNLALVPNASMPIRSPELFNGQWWERTSYYARFNEKVTKHSDVPYITSTDVRVVKG